MNNELDLAKEVFSRYIECNTFSEWHRTIRELSEKYHKTEKYLRYLVLAYVDGVADDRELEKYYYTNNKIKLTMNNYVFIVEDLLRLSTDEEKLDYLVSKKISRSNLKLYTEKYIGNNINPSNNSEVSRLYHLYISYCDENKVKQALKNKTDRLNEICNLFDEFVNEGYYNFYECRFYLVKSRSISSDEAFKVIDSCQKFLRKNAPLIYDTYVLKLKENQISKYNEIEFKVLQLFSKISDEKFDIVDYYLLMGMSICSFKRLCFDFITSDRQTMFNRKLGKYEKNDSSIVNKDNLLNDNYDFGNGVVDLETKEFVLSFMDFYEIPYCWFAPTLRKYVNGDLDAYLNYSQDSFQVGSMNRKNT